MRVPALRELAETLRGRLDAASVVERVLEVAADFEYETLAADDPGPIGVETVWR